MKTLSKRFAIIMLLTSMIVSCTANTGEQPLEVQESENAVTETETVIVETDPPITHDLPDIDWNGETFCVLGLDVENNNQFDNFEIYAAEENGTQLNDAIFRRNLAIEEKYNAIVTQSLTADSAGALRTAVAAGDDLYDTAFITIGNINALVTSGAFYNLNNVEYINFDKPYYNPEINNAMEIENKLYVTTSDFSLRDKSRVYIMLYNPEMAEAHGIPDLIETVRDGEWTADLMYDYVQRVSDDVNGDGKMDENDVYGLTMDAQPAFATFLFGMGNRIVSHNDTGELCLVMNTDRMVSSIEKVMKMACDKNLSFFCEDYQGKVDNMWYLAVNVFIAERALFTTAFPHMLEMASADCEFMYGVVPYPKYDESQEKHYSMINNWSMMFGIPVTSQTPEFSGFMIELLSAMSTDTTLKAYYDVACKTKYATNKETGEMLDLIFDGIICDPAIPYGFGGLYSIISLDIPQSCQNTFSSAYAAKEKGAEREIENITKIFKELSH